MVLAQYLRGARRGGNLLAGRPKILGEGGNENLEPPLILGNITSAIIFICDHFYLRHEGLSAGVEALEPDIRFLRRGAAENIPVQESDTMTSIPFFPHFHTSHLRLVR